MIFLMVTTNIPPVTLVKLLNSWKIIYIVTLDGQLFQQTVVIPIGTNCAPLLTALLLYSYDNEILDKVIKEGKIKLSHIVKLMALSL